MSSVILYLLICLGNFQYTCQTIYFKKSSEITLLPFCASAGGKWEYINVLDVQGHTGEAENRIVHLPKNTNSIPLKYG